MSDVPRTQQQLAALHRQAARDLAKIPGVIDVGYGLRERGGQVTSEIAFRVYVRRKRPLAELDPAAVIPAAYEGIPTDVLEENRFVPHQCADHDKHGTLAGGINISSYKKKADGTKEVGTLGFVATINGGKAPKNIAIVTNNHVVGLANERIGDYVYQPPWIRDASGTFKPAPIDEAEAKLLHAPEGTRTAGSPIGKIWARPDRQDHPFTYPGEQLDNYFIDCAAVRLAICISSLCHTNCSGFDFTRKIPGLRLTIPALNLQNSDEIIDVGRVAHADIGTPRAQVVKVGATTGRSTGEVIEVTAPVTDLAIHGRNAIKIHATGMNCAGTGTQEFSQRGDSGSAVINSEGKLVGLLFGGDQTDPTMSYASHIHPVLDALKVTPITRTNPLHDNAASVESLAEMSLVLGGVASQAYRLRERFLACARGRQIAELVERHTHEVVHLVNHNRRVTVTWHRNQGPAFLNRAMNNARDPEQLIPREIDGVSRRTLLASMGRALAEHGGAELRGDIERFREEVLARAEGCESLHELVDRLSQEQPA
jgi:Trypsin